MTRVNRIVAGAALVVALIVCICASTETSSAKVKTYNKWQYENVKGGVEVLGYTKKTSKLKVPKKIKGKRVVRVVGYMGQKQKFKCKSLNIPSYVKKVRGAVGPKEIYFNCKTITADSYLVSYENMEKATFGPKVREIKKDSFLANSGSAGSPWDEEIYDTRLKKVVFKKGVRKIGSYAFAGNDRVATIKLPSSVKKIGAYAFGFATCTESVEYALDVKPVSGFKLYGSSKATKNYIKKYKLKTIRSNLMDLKCKSGKWTVKRNDVLYAEYTGSAIKPVPGNVKRVDEYKPGKKSIFGYTSKDYKASYKGAVEPGKGTVTVNPKGYYTKGYSKSFYICPKVVTSAKWDVDGGSVVLSWDASEKADSYYIVLKPYVVKDGKNSITATTSETSHTFSLETGNAYDVYVYSCKTVSGLTHGAYYPDVKKLGIIKL